VAITCIDAILIIIDFDV